MTQSIDVSLYDRQIRTYGEEATKKITSSSVIITGLELGLGTEIAKNLVLGGVKNLYLYDNSSVDNEDVEYGIYYKEASLGSMRTKVLARELANLNPYTKIIELNGMELEKVSEDILTNVTLVIVNKSFVEAIRLNQLVRRFNGKTVFVCSKGFSGLIFVDVGPKHTVLDTTGENIEPVQLSNISSSGVVNCAYSCYHDFMTGDKIKLTNLEGNNLTFGKEWTITVKNKIEFSLNNFPETEFTFINGTAEFVPVPTVFNHQSLEEQLANPTILGFDTNVSKKIIEMYHDLFGMSCGSKKVLKKLERSLSVNVIPVMSLMGAFASAEVIKLVSHKYTPISQWWTWYDDTLIPDEQPDELGTTPLGKLLGKRVEEKLKNLNVLMVGCGALGCEWLKILAGLGVGVNGLIEITDPDHIEKSNLNRQFLFRPEHISKSKSKVAVKMIKQINPRMNLKAYTEKVGYSNPEVTKMLFNGKDVVINALDNVEARRFVDDTCLRNQLPLFESGTMGMKGNTQPVIPFITESYSNSVDPIEEKSFPVCTIKNFPNQILHTIHWARDGFDFFRRIPENISNYKNDSDFLSNLAGYEKSQAIEDINLFIKERNPSNWSDCVFWAIDMWAESYQNEIMQLLHNFPFDSLTEEGLPFWSKGKRCPTPLVFDFENNNIVNYVEATTHLLARCCGIDDDFTHDELKQIAMTYQLPKFIPEDNVKIAKDDTELKDMDGPIFKNKPLVSRDEITKTYQSQEFEKDDYTNWHVAWLTSASNCRALNYGIPVASYEETKGIAGRIIPAVATTTSAVVSLISLELIKYVMGVKSIDDYQSWFVNMADNTSVYANPVTAPMISIGSKKINSWTRFDFDRDVTLQQFIDIHNEKFSVNIDMVLSGTCILYASFMSCDNINELMSKLISEKLNIDVTQLSVEISLNCSEDVELPNIQLKIN